MCERDRVSVLCLSPSTALLGNPSALLVRGTRHSPPGRQPRLLIGQRVGAPEEEDVLMTLSSEEEVKRRIEET